MQLTINGETIHFDQPVSVAGLIEKLALDPRKIAIERNLEIVPQSEFDDTALAEGDELEIVHFIGGG